MPMRLRSPLTSVSGSKMSAPSKRIVPAMRTSSIRSFRRLMQRSKVDLPQPEGPMKAVIFFSGIESEISFNAFFSLYHSDSRSTSRIGSSTRGWRAGSSAGPVVAGFAGGGDVMVEVGVMVGVMEV